MFGLMNMYKEIFPVSQVVIQRKIRWLCHFTPRANLENIKSNGLKTRDLLSDREITVTDQVRSDQHKNAICLSISKPNKWMFEFKSKQGLDLCLLLISPEVLYKKNCLFYPHNAATASYRNIDIEELKGKQALENMFANPISYQKPGKPPQDIFRFHYVLDCETTSDQAEVQCLENIEPQYIIHIFEEDIPLTYDEILNYVDMINEPGTAALDRLALSPLFKESINNKLSKSIQKTNQVYTRPQETIKENSSSLESIVKKNQSALDSPTVAALFKETTNDKLGENIKKTTLSNVSSELLKKNSLNSKSSGDGCLGFIILVILIIIFVL